MPADLNLEKRIELLCKLGVYLQSGEESWANACTRAERANAWFTEDHIAWATENIAQQFLQPEQLHKWLAGYTLPATTVTVGIVMAGNIPLVGFHDFLCGFVSGHNLMLKLSSKDEVLMTHILSKLIEWEPLVFKQVKIAERLNDCDAYIATGSNNTSRYFHQYFGKKPNIIRSNRTSVAILDGSETDTQLEQLADDVYLYYGLGCRNVTQVFVPRGYNFEQLLRVFNGHNNYADLNKYKNNYDYHLAIYLLNNVPYMCNESILMVENDLPFSAVSVLHYKYYDDKAALAAGLSTNPDIQAIIGNGFVPFGTSQKPALADYADGVDTMAFLCSL
jgi:hypothetical protein